MPPAPIHHRRSIRLRGYDYGQVGAYFITIVAHGRECLFGNVVDNVVRLTLWGEIVRDEWARSGVVRPEIRLDEFVVMPNHVHGIVWICDTVGMHGAGTHVVGAQGLAPLQAMSAQGVPYRQPRSLGTMVAGFKMAVTRSINRMRGSPGTPVWQRNYWEHIIRDEEELGQVRQYIAENPLRWAEDRENPDATGQL